jgi:CheY-like chemotaxis protein
VMNTKIETRVLLLVEDNPADAELVKEMLESASAQTFYHVRHVPRLSDAEEILRQDRIDVVLLDLRQPDASGVDGVRSLLDVSHELPIVVLTGMQDEELALACIDAGAQDYLNKEEMRPILLRRAIGYAITRLRETQLRELQGMLSHYRTLSSAGTLTSVTAAMAGLGPFKDRKPQVYDGLISSYAQLLDAYIEQLGYKREKPRDLMETIATRLGDTGAGPRDLLDVHVAALENAVQGAGMERARSVVIEGRLLALEMMGLLVDYYRVGNRRRFAPGDKS